jgi:hypothetical protein
MQYLTMRYQLQASRLLNVSFMGCDKAANERLPGGVRFREASLICYRYGIEGFLEKFHIAIFWSTFAPLGPTVIS